MTIPPRAHNLGEDSTDVTKQDNSGYFSDEELQEDEKEEVTDDDFFHLLNKNILQNDIARKRTPEEDCLHQEEHEDIADTMGFVNEEALFDAEVIGQIEDLQRLTADPLPLGPGEWQGHTAQGSHANDN
jgi:hypothetical protein